MRTKKKDSIASIAARVGVSAFSVSCVINNRPGVSDETRERIQKILDETGYSRNYKLSDGRTIGLVLPGSWTDWYLSELTRGCIDCISASNCNIATIVCQPKGDKSLLLELRKHNCDAAVIAVPLHMMNKIEEVVENSNMPIIIMDADMDDFDIKEDNKKKIGYINNDSYQGAYILTKHIMELGHKNIAFLGRHYGWHENNQNDRINAWKDAMRENDISEKSLSGLLKFENDDNIISTIIEDKSISAVMCVDDYMALKLMSACYEKRIRIPDELTVAGFGNVGLSENFSPPLTTVDQNVFEVGYKAMDCAIKLATGKMKDIPRELIPVKLVNRKSSEKRSF